MVLVLKTAADASEPEREVLFSIDGEEYTIPVVFGANVSLQFARVSMMRGSDVAVSWALEEALGPRGHAALMNFRDLTAEQLSEVTQTILARIVGGMEAPKAGLRAV